MTARPSVPSEAEMLKVRPTELELAQLSKAMRDAGITSAGMMIFRRALFALSSQEAAPCPHVRTSADGTAYCTLAESSGEAPALPSLEDTARLDWLEAEGFRVCAYDVPVGMSLREAIDAARLASPPAEPPQENQ